MDEHLRVLSTRGWAGGFDRVRLLERLGLVEPAHDDTYVLAFLGGFGDPARPHGGRGKVELLAQDTDLRDELLWRLFEVEGGGEVSLANLDRFYPDGWQAAFRRLVAEGTIARERVLGSCLEALQRDFGGYRAAWFSATYNAFEPSTDERDRHQPQLRALLASPLPATVAFAVRHLRALGKAALLDAEATLPLLPGAVLVRTKGTALDVLRLAGSWSDSHRDQVVPVGQAALGHDSPDVQRAAASLLERCDHREAVLAEAEALAPTVQHSLGLRVTTRVPDAPLVQPLEPVAAPVTRSDLLERTAALLEGGASSAELEAVLAGLAGLATPDLLSPLRKRALSVARRDPPGLPGTLGRLVLACLGEPSDPAVPATELQRLVVRRLDEVGRVVVGSAPRRPLLATPDLAGGWVSPQALAERLSAGPALEHDLAAARLRLYGCDDPPPGHLAELRSLRLTGTLQNFTWSEAGRERTGRYYRWEPFGALALPHPLGDWVPVLAAVWPHDAEAFAALVVGQALEAANDPTVLRDLPAALDALARHPGRHGELSRTMLAAALAAGRGDQRMHAADAFVDLVPTGRIAAADLAESMSRYADGWTATRWVDSLRRAAQAPGASASVAGVLAALVTRLGPGFRGLGGFLELLHEQSLRLGHRPADPALRAVLESVTGSSKAGRAARALLA